MVVRLTQNRCISENSQQGFTIVELLIVIVIIGILAAITIVAYNGVTNHATIAQVQAGFKSATSAIAQDQVLNSDTYPVSPSSNPGPNFTYTRINNGASYCLNYSNGGHSYFATAAHTSPSLGNCSGLIGWWTFDGDASDSSGNGMAGTVTNATLATGQNSAANSAYYFNGSSQIVIPNSAAYFALTQGVTISAWVKPAVITGFTNGSSIIVWNNTNNTASPFRLDLTNNGGAGDDWNSTTTGCPSQFNWCHLLSATNLISTGNWYNLVMVRSDTQTELFVNGTLASSMSVGYATAPVTNISQNVSIGGMLSDTTFSNYTGSMDDVRIYNRALSNSEVTDLYTAGAL